MVPTGGTGRDREQRMDSKQSVDAAGRAPEADEAIAGRADLPRLTA